MDGATVITRPFIPEEDEAFIYATWRNSAYFGQPNRPKDSKDEAREKFKLYTAKIRKILDREATQVKIACLQSDPTFIVGYLVSEKNHLHWAYTKEDYRQTGIANLLGFNKFETYPSEVTKIGLEILKKKNNKENAHGRTDSGTKEEQEAKDQ
jgi:hypothetical protein